MFGLTQIVKCPTRINLNCNSRGYSIIMFTLSGGERGEVRGGPSECKYMRKGEREETCQSKLEHIYFFD